MASSGSGSDLHTICFLTSTDFGTFFSRFFIQLTIAKVMKVVFLRSFLHVELGFPVCNQIFIAFDMVVLATRNAKIY